MYQAVEYQGTHLFVNKFQVWFGITIPQENKLSLWFDCLSPSIPSLITPAPPTTVVDIWHPCIFTTC